MENKTLQTEKIYILMNKPFGYVCTNVSDSHPTVFSLFPESMQNQVYKAKRGTRLHSVGRLDSNTTGLLLFTNDGELSHKLTSPDYKVPKTYEVILKDEVNSENQEIYKKTAEQEMILPPEKKVPEQKISGAIIQWQKETLSSSTRKCFITVKEGKFHEVRRIFSALKNEVVSLKRISFGNLMLPDPSVLPEGTYRFLTEEEIKQIQSFKKI